MVEKSENSAMDDNENYLEVRKSASLSWCRKVCGWCLCLLNDFLLNFLESFGREKIIKRKRSRSISYHFDLPSQLSKMNFSPFTTSFANVNVNQFAKFTQNLATPSQVSDVFD